MIFIFCNMARTVDLPINSGDLFGGPGLCLKKEFHINGPDLMINYVMTVRLAEAGYHMLKDLMVYNAQGF